MIRAVVFDLDGTLVDSLADIAAAVNSALVGHGRSAHPVEAYRSMVGWGLRRLLVTATREQPFSEPEFSRVFDQLMEAYRARPVVFTRPYDGVGALLEAQQPRLPLGVLSNKEDGMTKTIVSAVFPRVGFRAVWGARPGVAHKPDPEALTAMLDGWSVRPEECAYLGDSGVDMETARRAGTSACGALWGFRDAAELERAGAHDLFATPADFGRWLESRTA